MCKCNCVNCYCKKYKDISDDILIETYKALYNLVFCIECYSSNDITEFFEIDAELEKRGYEINTASEVIINKK